MALNDIGELLFYLLLLLISFYLLNFFSEHYFIPSLDEIGKKLKMSSDISGATLMAAGSSAPELAVVVISVLKAGNHEAIGVGTIVGSALFNLFIITGTVMVIIKKAKLVWQPLTRDLLFYGLSVILLVVAFKDGHISVFEAMGFVIGYVLYISVLYTWKKIFPYKDIESIDDLEEEETMPGRLEAFLKIIFRKSKNKYIAFFMSIVAISLLSWTLVESAIKISAILQVPEIIVALTVVALGTSVPDLVSSIIVAKQGRAGMAVNNAIGSNIFDILIGLGLPLLLMLVVKWGSTVNVSSTDLDVAFIFLMGSIVILTFAFILNKWHTSKLTGYILIILYSIYLLFEIICKMGGDFC
jgi:K+-dependent Na+/Ca+ exchanger-like protein